MANKYCKHKVGSHLRWLLPIVFHWQSSRCDLSRTKRVGRNAVFLSDKYLWTILRFPNALRILARKWKPILPTYVLQHFGTFRTTFFSPVNIKLTHSRIQWMILAVCEAGASDTYEGKEMTDPTMHITKSRSLDQNSFLRCHGNWKIKIGWDYLFVKADQYFDDFCEICCFKNLFFGQLRNLSLAKCMRSIFAEISNNEVVNVRKCRQMLDKNMNCETFWIF